MNHTQTIIAVDPGVSTGYAIFQGKHLMEAGTIRKDHMEALAKLVCQEKPGATKLIVVIEEPGVRFREGRKEFLRAKSMATLNQRAGGYHAIAQALGVDTIRVTPSCWMRGRNKVRVKEEMRLIYAARLRAIESSPLSQDAYDAIGIGHYTIGQLAVRERILLTR